MRWPSRVLLVAVIFFDYVAAMLPSFSRFAFSYGWLTMLLFVTVPVSQTIAHPHSTMSKPNSHTLAYHSNQDTIVAEKAHKRPQPEKIQRKNSTKRPQEKLTQKRQPSTAPVASHPVTAPVVVPQTTAPGANMQVKGFRVQVYTGFSDRASRNAALQVQKDIRRRFPEIATYVHFISPRWICRVGNFIRREDAIHYARLIRAAHLSSEAAVVACPILVRRHTPLP